MRHAAIAVLVAIIVSAAPAAPRQQGQQPSPPLLTGRVLDSQTEAPVAGARVIVGKKGAVTDKKGNYRLPLKGQEFGDIITVRVVADDYEMKIIPGVIVSDPREMKLEIPISRIQKKVRKVFKLKYRRPTDVAQVLSAGQDKSVKISVSNKFMTISAVGYPDRLAELERLINELDTPLKKIWLEVKFIRALEDEGRKPYVADEISDIARRLGSLFRFRQYYLVGHATATGVEDQPLYLETTAADTAVSQFIIETVPHYRNGIIQLEDLRMRFWWRPQGLLKSPDSKMESTLNLKNGETVILGAAQGSKQRGAIIAVVTAKILE